MKGSLSCLASLAFAVLFVVGCGTDGNSAKELEALGPVSRDFYANGLVSNPCGGPCDENDLIAP